MDSVGDSTSPIMQSREEVVERVIGDTDSIVNEVGNKASNDSLATSSEMKGGNEDQIQKGKRLKKSSIWSEFKEDKDKDGFVRISCNHCKKSFAKSKTTPTTQFHRHLQNCAAHLKAKSEKERSTQSQTQLGFLSSTIDPSSYPALHDGKIDMEVMKELIANWIMMHEHPFSIVEEEGFNLMQRRGIPEWKSISRTTATNYCVKVYEIEKKELKTLLKSVTKISLTTDCWKSKSQRIEYMVITGHWIDQNWQLQKRVLNYVHIPPPRRGLEVADVVWRCLKDWGIESKIQTISVDNASSNDSAIENLKIYI